jgi:hypothetical protein
MAGIVSGNEEARKRIAGAVENLSRPEGRGLVAGILLRCNWQQRFGEIVPNP